ncbi:MAG: aminodeoxychorismate/anthranilate synthase component II, partial [Bacteroidetes bacterium]|nr:aminodeoxychorismate/anthranilate synthase component II [Bacteroidota bacterium]
GRYHSWIVDRESIPSCLEITAVDHENQIMAIRHKKYKVVGVQFHPESVLTPEGEQMLINFLNE